MEHYALIGYPLGHSISPEIHKKLFALSGMPECSYHLFPIPLEGLQKRIPELKQLRGFNVTIPYKQEIIPFLHSLDRSAQRYHAVNVVLNQEGRMSGYNTDVTGFLKSVEELGCSFLGKRILVLGYGGAGRMMAAEAAWQGASEVLLAARAASVSKAAVLAQQLASQNPAARISAVCLDDVRGKYDLIVNSTPSGMYPHINESPLRKEQLKGSIALFDAIYNPGETRLMADAKACGLKTAGGMTMLVWQAAAAHKIWYGAQFNSEEITALIKEMEEYVLHHFQNHKNQGDTI